MSMPQASSPSLWHHTGFGNHLAGRAVKDNQATVLLADLEHRSGLGRDLETLRGQSVLVATQDQLVTVLAMIELDGVASRIVLCPPDTLTTHASSVIQAASIGVAVADHKSYGHVARHIDRVLKFDTGLGHAAERRPDVSRTEWVLLTSGTTGGPKLVAHTLASLLGPIDHRQQPQVPVVWSTFYDIRRYGGLQIILRTLTGGASMVLSSADETPEAFLSRAGASCVTHMSGTPSHWRRAAMGQLASKIAPFYIRLSGEIADQSILDHLRGLYPDSKIVHAFASTEAGVAFEVTDQRAGFPAILIDQQNPLVEIRVEEGSLLVRSERTAHRYLGDGAPKLKDTHGFVNTRDKVERQGDRYYFVGREDGVINVGGLKVHPEEVEGVINRHPLVRMSRVRPRNNPITGAVVVADIVPISEAGSQGGNASGSVGSARLRDEILQLCRTAMADYKVPAIIRFVGSLDITPAGKVARGHAESVRV